MVIPPSIKDNALALKVYVEAVKTLQEAYSQLCELGIAREDARYILPNGQTSSLVMTMNARELHHFFRLRLCRRAQWEIRELARQMLKLCKSVAPKLFENAGPACITGKCEEARPCGKPYRDTEELLNA